MGDRVHKFRVNESDFGIELSFTCEVTSDIVTSDFGISWYML